MKFSRKTVKIGTFTLILTAVVLAVLIALNLFASELPAGVKNIDTTKEQIYTIGDKTKDLLKNITDEVELFLLIEEGKETDTTAEVEGLIAQYTGANSNIKYKRIDPVVNPNFSKQFTDETLSSDSVIVVSGPKNRIIYGNEWEMYETDQGRLTSDQYRTYEMMMMNYYGQVPESTELFMGETNLTSAIAYVTSENTEKVYTLTGHGEQTVSEGFAEIITSSNIDLEDLNLLTGDGTIPDDCTMLIINYPSQDISEKEVETLSDYYTNGGTVFLVTTVEYINQNAQPNLMSLASKAGMQPADGIVFEGDPSHYQSYQYYLVPSVGDSAPDALRGESSLTYFMPASHGIEEKEGTGAKFIPLLVTTDSSYMKTDIYNIQHLEKEEGDTDGPFTVAALSTLDGGDTESAFYWFASPAFLEKQADYGGNSSLFKSIISLSFKGNVSISIDPKVISSESLTVTESDATLWKTVFIAVIPIAVLIGGFSVWIVRRKKR